MPHVELSLIDSRRLSSAGDCPAEPADSPRPGGAGRAGPAIPHSRPAAEPPPDSADPDRSLLRWAAVVTGAAEPTMVTDASSTVVAASAGCAELLACGDPADLRGRRIHDALTHLVDFTDPPDPLDTAESAKIPPLLAISSDRLARGLIRVAPACSDRPRTLDAVAAPLWEGDTVVGSVTFFARV